jgi:hypothetical protein
MSANGVVAGLALAPTGAFLASLAPWQGETVARRVVAGEGS